MQNDLNFTGPIISGNLSRIIVQTVDVAVELEEFTLKNSFHFEYHIKWVERR